jgi:predicted alpha/beta superfamily hydrolase
MRKSSFLLCLLFTVKILVAQETKTAFVLGETVTIKSKTLHEDRTLNIYLPPSYGADSLRKFPVIYLLDGSADEDFIHTVGLVQYGNFPWINMLSETIVVGIANVDRKRDFTFPTTIEKDKKDFPTTGGSAKFIQFLDSELLPYVTENYRTNDTTTLIGQSLGGLLATEILFKQPDMFRNYIIISPSLWWNHESLLKQVTDLNTNGKTVFIGVGKKEPKPMERDARKLYRVLKSQRNKGLNLYYKLFKKQGHGDILHVALYEAFLQVF